MNEEIENKLRKSTEDILNLGDSLGHDNNLLVAAIDNLFKANKEERLQIVSKWKEEAVTEDEQIKTIELLLKSEEQLKGFLNLRLRTLRTRKRIINMPRESLSPLVIKQIEELT